MENNPIVKISFKGQTHECFEGYLIIKVDPKLLNDHEGIQRLLTELLGVKFPFKLITPFDENGIGLIDIGKADLQEAAELLEKNKEIIYAEPNDVIHLYDNPSVTPQDPLFSQQWSLLTIQAPAAWNVTEGSDNVVISVIDTGISISGNPLALSHEDLSDSSRIFLGTNYINTSLMPIDDHGHGTHVAGIAAAESNNGKGIAGVNWKCRVFVCKVFNHLGAGGSFAFYKAVNESIAFAKSKNWKLVINYSGEAPFSATAEEAIKLIQQGGALLCASAGNDSGPVGYPAAFSTKNDGSVRYSNVIAVSATNRGDEIAPFSNRGIQVNVAAPGVDILSTLPPYRVTLNDPPSNKQMNYDILSGTSMAAPIVSGLSALVWTVAPNLTASQVRERIQATAVDLPPAGRDIFFGYGRVNAYVAVSYQTPPPPPPLNPWDDPAVRQLMDEWLQQTDRCLKKHHPSAWVDRWGRMCGNLSHGRYVSCVTTPDNVPAGWDNYHYLWWTDSWLPANEYYSYTVKKYVDLRLSGQSYQSLTKCK